MERFKVGDSIRFKKSGFTAKIISIGPDPETPEDTEERYFLKFSMDDEELVVGEGNKILRMSIPIEKAHRDGYIEKLN